MKTNLTATPLRLNTEPVNSFNHDELEVVQIMLSLPDLIAEFDNHNKEHIPREIPHWRCKRRRSATGVDDVHIISPPSPSSLPSLEKPKLRSVKKKKVPKKMSKKELEEKLDELTECKRVFLLGIERARIFYEEQKALNFRLKEFIKSNEGLQSLVNRRLNLLKQETNDDEDAEDDDDRYNDEDHGADQEEEYGDNTNDDR